MPRGPRQLRPALSVSNLMVQPGAPREYSFTPLESFATEITLTYASTDVTKTRA
jgi:hypothetical protein